MDDAWAHTRTTPDGTQVLHVLESHLRAPAAHAAEFAKACGPEKWGCLAGLWHDPAIVQQKPAGRRWS